MNSLCVCCHNLFRAVCGKSMKAGAFVFAMRTVVTLLNACPLYVTNSGEMLDFMTNPMDRFLY